MNKGNDIAMGMVIGAGKNKAVADNFAGGMQCPECGVKVARIAIEICGCQKCGAALMDAPVIRINKNALGMP